MFKQNTARVLTLATTFLLTSQLNLTTLALSEEDRSQTVKQKSSEWMLRTKEAETLKGEGKLAEAASIFEKMLAERKALNLDLLSERIALAQIYEKLKREDDAARQYKILIEEREKQAGGEDDVTVAFPIRQYAEFLARTGNETLSTEMKARVRKIENNSRSTVSDIKLAKKIAEGEGSNFNKAEKLRKIGALWLQKSDSRKAKVYLEKSIELNPENPESFCDRAETNYFDGDDKAALSDFRKAISIDGKFARAYFGTGRLYSGRNNYGKAISEYSKAIERDPKNIEYLGARAKLFDTTGKHKKAVEDYTTVLAIRPGCIWARVQRATAYEGMKEYDKAAHDLTVLIDRYPKDNDFYEYRGKAYLNGGMFKNAIADYSKVIELSPKYAGGYLGRSRAWEKLEGKNSKNAENDLALAKKFGYTPR